MRKLLFWLMWLTLLAVIGMGVWWYYALPRLPEWPKLEEKQATSVHSIVVEEVKGLGKLELVKVSFQDVIVHEVAVPYLPDPKVMLKVFGETVACVDLARIDSGDVRVEGDTILLDLPAPEICYNRIDHQRSQIVDTWYTAMYAEGQRLIDRAFEMGEEKMRESALKGDIYGEAEAQAQRTLRPLLEQITGKRVFLRFPARREALPPPVEQPLAWPEPTDSSQELRPEGIRP